MKRFRGLIPPVVTPIAGGEVDRVGIAALVEHTVGHLDGIVVGGSCGEGPSLGRSRRRQALLQFMNVVDGRIPVVAGVASTSLADIRELIAEGDGLGVAGYLVPPPFYFSNSPAGVSTFFAEVARTTDREVIIYDNPKTTKTVMTVELIASIVGESSNINHVKVTDPDLDKVAGLSQTCDATLLAGSDELMHHQIVRGCEGAVTAAPQVFPQACRAWFDAARDPTGETARTLYNRLLPFVIELLLGPDQYPAVVKHALFRLGVISSDEVLPPLTPLDERRRVEIGALLESYALDVSA
jgi:4-hydroxy-tetrahydrodipicolinate synthase